ncbi:intermembrane transport protein PqiB [Oceanospirillum beijerinckii]|uniref:intermembrane transport protein PqiB n=1 Tax=Oceanospirillum beijerinckii TaxID=64976 RepID=UPI0004083C4E|nr:intermembrane transport protein PqiB [Oceanospirillum beijerinckii]
MSNNTPDNQPTDSPSSESKQTDSHDNGFTQPTPRPIISARRSISTIWLLPLIALAISGWMIYHDWANRGQLIRVHFITAEGIEVGKTKIKVRNVEIGKVESLSLNYPNNGVIINARIEPDAIELLHNDSEFWVVRPRIGASGISGLGTLLSGAYIEMNPGQHGEPPPQYYGLESPPVASASEPGLRLKLASNEGFSLNVGDKVLFRGFPVGRIESIQFDTKDREALYGIFIQAPYDRLVNSESRFWNISGVNLNLSSEGVSFHAGSLDTLISGGIAFDQLTEHAPNDINVEQAKAGQRFRLHPDFNSVREAPFDHYNEYLLMFDESVRGLLPGAPVEFRGVKLGAVERISFRRDELNYENDPRIPVVIRMEPGRLGFSDSEDVLMQSHLQMLYWVNRGMRASLKPGNLLTGSLFVDLDIYPDAKEAYVEQIGDYRVLPTVSSGFAQIEAKLLAILNKMEQLQIEPVLAQAQQTLQQAQGSLRSGEKAIKQMETTLQKIEQLAANPQTQAIPEEINHTLREIRLTAQGLSPDSRLYQEMNRSLRTLQQTMEQLQPVLQALDQKSNALIFEAPKGPDVVPGQMDKESR